MKSHPLSVTFGAPASDCSLQTSIAGRVSCWDTVEVSALVFGAVGCILLPWPPRSRSPRRRTQRRSPPVAPAAPSRTGSLLAGAGPGPTAPVTMVSGRGGRQGEQKGEGVGEVGGVAAPAHVHSRDWVWERGSAPTAGPLAFGPPGVLSREGYRGPPRPSSEGPTGPRAHPAAPHGCSAKGTPGLAPMLPAPHPRPPLPARSSQVSEGCRPAGAR